MFIQISEGTYIPINEIKLINQYDGRVISRLVKDLKEKELILDMTSGKKKNTVILLKDNTGILITESAESVIERIRKVSV